MLLQPYYTKTLFLHFTYLSKSYNLKRKISFLHMFLVLDFRNNRIKGMNPKGSEVEKKKKNLEG